jgi:hypothetical protein
MAVGFALGMALASGDLSASWSQWLALVSRLLPRAGLLLYTTTGGFRRRAPDRPPLITIDDSETEYLIERLDRAIPTVEAKHQQRPPSHDDHRSPHPHRVDPQRSRDPRRAAVTRPTRPPGSVDPTAQRH